MRYETYTETQAEPSLSELFSNLSNQATLLIRQEIRLAEAELTRKARKAATNVTYIAVGAVVGLAAFYSLVAALIFALASVMSLWLAAALVGVLLAIISAVVIAYGWNKLKEIDPAPRRTIETMRENKEWLTQQI